MHEESDRTNFILWECLFLENKIESSRSKLATGFSPLESRCSPQPFHDVYILVTQEAMECQLLHNVSRYAVID